MWLYCTFNCNASYCCRKSVYHSALALFKWKLERKWMKCKNGQCECASGKIQTQTNDEHRLQSSIKSHCPQKFCVANKPAMNTEIIQWTAHKLWENSHHTEVVRELWTTNTVKNCVWSNTPTKIQEDWNCPQNIWYATLTHADMETTY